MVAFQEKQTFRRIIYSRPVFVVLFVVLVILGFSLIERYVIEQETREKLTLVKREQEVLLAKESDLKARLERLQTIRGTEEEVRKKFRVAKEGEGVIIVVEPKATKSIEKTANGFWAWFTIFFNE